MTIHPRYNLWALLWTMVILILCMIPGNEIPHLKFLDWLKPDKIVHFVMFGTLSFLLIGAFLEQNKFNGIYNHAKLYSVLISCTYGVVIELLQHYITVIHRSGEVFDAVADAVGALVGLWLFNVLRRKKVIIVSTNKKSIKISNRFTD